MNLDYQKLINTNQSSDNSSESESYGDDLSYDTNLSKIDSNLATYSNENNKTKEPNTIELNINDVMDNIMNFESSVMIGEIDFMKNI